MHLLGGMMSEYTEPDESDMTEMNIDDDNH